jgi:hypothetical protein
MDKEKMKECEKLAKDIGELEGMDEVENKIKNNIIEFSIDNRDIKYRVRLPNYEEQQEFSKYRRKKHLKFMQDESVKTEKQWKEIYLKKGIDIDEMDKKVSLLNRSMQEKMLKLAETNEEIRVEKLKEEILTIRKNIAETQVEKTDYLTDSLENLLLVSVSGFMVYLILEKLVEDKWVKVFTSYDECKKSKDSALFNKAFYYSTFLQTQHLN